MGSETVFQFFALLFLGVVLGALFGFSVAYY